MINLKNSETKLNLSKTDPAYNKGIATLRGMAIILVFFSHLQVNVSHNLLFTIGRIGVVIFFMISGMLSVQAREKRTSFKYLLNRFIKLFPEYWLILLLELSVTSGISVKSIWLNAFLINGLFGENPIIGSSWMLPIMAIFFIIVALCKPTAEKYAVLLGLFSMISVLMGLARYMTGKTVPTAIPLLICISIIGVLTSYIKMGDSYVKYLIFCCFIYEVSLFIGTWLSYDNWIYYIVAYNLGMLIFAVMVHYNLYMKLLDYLGKLGFPFFLCFDFSYMLMVKFGIIRYGEFMTPLACLICFIICLIISWLIVIFVEKPIKYICNI